jgi:hypothetical protein
MCGMEKQRCAGCLGFVSADPVKARRHDACADLPPRDVFLERLGKQFDRQSERAEQREGVKLAIAREERLP